MTLKTFFIVLFSLCCVITHATAQVIAGNAKAGEQKAMACAACHGADGNSLVDTWPKLAGQHETYLVSQLMMFQEGAAGGRYEPTMSAMAASLSKQDMRDIAAFYASQSIKTGTAESEHVVLGQKIYRVGDKQKNIPACMACHGPNGAGNAAAHYPALAGQHMAYTFKQLQAFRDDKRSNDANAVMRDIADRMTDAEMQAVASYIAGLH